MDITKSNIETITEEELAEIIVDNLRKKTLTLASAESCTGGLFASEIINLSGASDVFDRALVTYSNRAKIEELGVSKGTLENFGAVSSETSEEMAIGLKKVSKCDVCVSVTGIAGPNGASEDKPVGLVYMSAIYKDFLLTKEFKFGNIGRNIVRHKSVIEMLKLVYEVLGVSNEKR